MQLMNFALVLLFTFIYSMQYLNYWSDFCFYVTWRWGL